MTSREGFDAYTLYLAIKLHFYSKNYDFVKYNGKVKSANLNSFLKRKDKYFFGKLYKEYGQNLQDFYISNLCNKDTWVGDLLSEECDRTYKEWKSKIQRLTYLFDTEMHDLLLEQDLNSILNVENGQHPILLKKLLAKSISLETVCILDDILDFTEVWKETIEENIVYPSIHTKITKYKTFLNYDQKKFKGSLLKLCST